MASLRRLTAVFVGAFGIATVVTGYATYSASRATIENLVDRRLAAVSRALLDEARPGDATSLLLHISMLSQQRDTGDIGFELTDARGRRLGGNVAVSGAVPAGFSTVRSDDDVMRVQRRAAGNGLQLLTLVELEPVDGYQGAWLRSFVIGFGAMLVIVVAGAVSFSRLVRRRIGEVRATAEAIIDGDLTQRIPVERGAGAFAAQAVTFNRMLDRIAALVDSLRHVGGDIAHDMRTPLARLRSRLAVIAEEATTPELEAALEQCDELLAMFSAMLRISEVEGGDRRAAFDVVDLASIASEVAETLAEAANDSGHRLGIARLDTGNVEGDRQLLSQAMLNLVENALAHTPAGSQVSIAVERSGDDMVLRIQDDGPGIPATDHAAALRRFGRLDASRNRPGHGLGLPLVDAIVRMHGGTLRLGDASPGLRVTIALPRRR